MVELFKEDLNMARFKNSCDAVTQAFQKISVKVRHVEEKMLGQGKDAQRMAGLVRQIQNLEKQHLVVRVAINEKTVKLALMDYELQRQKFIKKTIEDCDIEV